MARVTVLVLPVLARQPRALVFSLSSGAYIGVPWLVIYGATKAFNLAFGVRLARELAGYTDTAYVDLSSNTAISRTVQPVPTSNKPLG
jgi:17beta-estradiol 17-dehydrogenase / very-long-chain 3-oxoacyl-CoA reductase